MTAEESNDAEYLISQSTHTCLTVISGTGVHDAVIGLAKCTGGVKQQWFYKNQQWQWGCNRSLCLAKNDTTGQLCLATCSSVTEPWFHDQEQRLTLGSQALDVPWPKPRTSIIFYAKHSGNNQKWWTLSQLKACLEDNDLAGEHCLAPSVLDICKKDLRRAAVKAKALKGQKPCNCQVGSDFTMLSKAGEIISAESFGTSPEYLVSQSTLTCLAVLSGTGPDDAVVGLSPFSGDINQQWIVNGNQWLWGGNPSYSLEPNWKDGTLQLGEAGSSSTTWNFDDAGLMESNSNYLDVPWESPRTHVIAYPHKHGGENQKWWRLSDVQSAIQADSAAKANYPGNLLKMAEKVPFQKIDCVCQCQGQDLLDTSFDIQDDGEPEYLISQSTHTCLTVLSGTCPDDAVIGLAPYAGDSKQQWFITGGQWQWGGNRSYCLAPDFPGRCLCLVLNNEASTSWSLDKAGVFMSGLLALDVPWDGDRKSVTLYPKHGGINQKWWILSKLKSCVGHKMYPFSASDRNVFQQELARGIVNRLCPLSEPLPHPRDVGCYPGTVATTTPRINSSCTLNVGTVRQAKNLRMTVPEDWQATNMYVAAGDVFTVILPDTLTEKQAEQITIRVGAHRDCLDPESPNLKKGVFKRMPVVSEEFDVNSGINRLRSQFGGNLIFTYEGEESFRVTAQIENVVETPYYVLGKTDNAAWQKMKNLDAPFSVLETDKVVLIAPTSEVKKVSNLDELLYRYDNIITKLEDLAGFTKNDPPPQGKQWLVDDVQITAGSAHAGFPAMFDHQYYNLTRLETPHDWVVWHELGHNYQQGPYWSYAYGTESTVNLFSLYIEEQLKSDDRMKREGKYMPTIKAVDKGLTFETADCWQKLVFLMEMKHAYPDHGWDMYRHLNRTIRALSEEEAQTLESKVQNQYDFVYSTVSRYIEIDLIPHYRRWGLAISENVRNEVTSLGLPKSPQSLSANFHPDQSILA